MVQMQRLFLNEPDESFKNRTKKPNQKKVKKALSV